MDPVRNPYAPGAGQRPPELAGRDDELRQLSVLLERSAAGRPARGLVLTGLRGVGKTVLLNAMRSRAIRAGWATGRIEARPDTSLRAPIAHALHAGMRDLSSRVRNRARVGRFLAVLRAFSLTAEAGGNVQLAIDVDPARGRADSGDLEVDLTELFADAADIAADLGRGVALFVDELQDAPTADLVAVCGACHEMSQTGRPLLLIAAGLPPLPATLSAARSYAERLFTYLSIDRLDPAASRAALVVPASREGVGFTRGALDLLSALADGYPYFIQAYGKATWDAAVTSPITATDVRTAESAADHELAVGFFGSRYERATRVERRYMIAMAQTGDRPVSTADVARVLSRPIRSLSPVRDGLIKKGLIYSSERGLVAFTVPHFAAYLRRQD